MTAEQLAHRDPLAWLPNDRYVYETDLTLKEWGKVITGSMLFVIVAACVLLAIGFAGVQ